MLLELLSEPRFNFIPSEQKSFMLAFDEEMEMNGYGFGENIGSGYCWGKYMLIYRKKGVKSERVYARVYLRVPMIVFRLFLNDIDKHRAFIENSAPYIKEVFTGPQAQCQHCHNDKNGSCRFRKSYMLENQYFEKCTGLTFEFHNPSVEKLPGYLGLFLEFYPPKTHNG